MFNEHFLKQRQVFIWGDITEMSARVAILQLKYLADQNEKDIYIYVSSDGGDVDAALSIIDEISLIQQKIIVHTIAYKACSAAAYILACGTRDCRWVNTNAIVMLHPVSYELAEDHAEKHEKYIEFQKEMIEDLTRFVAKSCGKSVSKFGRDISNGLWLNARAAVKYGIADKVLENSEELKGKSEI